jgi:hypothetical protein
VGGRRKRATHCGSPNDWDAFRLRPQGVPVDPAFRNALGRGRGTKVSAQSLARQSGKARTVL